MNTQNLSGLIPDKVLVLLTPDFLKTGKIDGPKRLSHYLGQTMEETGVFTVFMENLNYSGKGLAKTWPNRYAIDPHAAEKEPNALALKLQHDPVAIANNCYCNRNGNGDEASGEGYLYRGRGPIQLTGKSAYQGLENWLKENGEDIDVMYYPYIVATDLRIGLLSATWIFGVAKKLWPVCDRGVDMETVKEVTKSVNGAFINLDTRFAHTQTIYKALTS